MPWALQNSTGRLLSNIIERYNGVEEVDQGGGKGGC